MRRLAALLLLLPLVSACSSGSAGGVQPGPAKTYKLFTDIGLIRPGRPVTMAFTIRQPSGKTLTQFRTGSGPHTGVHLIIVRDDLAYIIHRHPRIQPNGRFAQRVVFPAKGRYLIVVDTYPRHGPLPNFQLTDYVSVVDPNEKKRPLGRYRSSTVVDGFHFVAPSHPHLRASQAEFMTVHVTAPNGPPARFVPWYGALAHAIFFRAGTLDYFHSHVCAPGATGCASFVGAAKIAGHSTAPGKLTIGVLVPTPGTWKMFLQAKPDGHLVTVPYVLHVAP